MQIVLGNDGKVYQIKGLALEEVDNELVERGLKSLTEKERLMKAKSLLLVHKKSNRIIFELNMIQNQHFYPLSILDYANSMLNLMKNKISALPILSLDSHDYNYCDFNCKDCLAVDTREWAKKNLGFDVIDPDDYEAVLKEIARYSKKRGCDSIRFEMSGEGNPDMYKYRKRIIEYAAKKCNMKPVYISSGSMLDEDTIDALAKYAYYIRISLPGLNEIAYEKYSSQKKNAAQKFTYKKAIELIQKLVQKRKEYHREEVLMIGARTCMRPENEGSYIDAAKTLGKIGADSFQIVKILVPEGEDINSYKLSDKTVKELTKLKTTYKNYGLMHVQISHDLDYMYYDRKIEDNKKPCTCYSSFVSPILYGPYLIVCTHWEKIKDVKNSYYGKMEGKENELEEMICGKNGERIRKSIPERCSSCCSIFDNQMLEIIRAQLAIVTNLDDVEFLLTY